MTTALPKEITVDSPSLLLRVPCESDVPAITEACQDLEIQRWTTIPSPYHERHAQWFVNEMVPANFADGGGDWLIVDPKRDQLLGTIGARPVSGLDPVPNEAGERICLTLDLGYWLTPAGRGRGITEAAIRAVCEAAFAAGTQTILWCCEVIDGQLNWASWKAAWRCGFHRVGVIPASAANKGQAVDRLHAYLQSGDEMCPRAPWDGPNGKPEDYRVGQANEYDPHALVNQFHHVYRMPRGQAGPTLELADGRITLRMNLIAEEFAELFGAVYGRKARAIIEEAVSQAMATDEGERDVVETADALADLIYVIYGMGIECDLNLPGVLEQVQASNLSKLGADGEPIYRADGKVMKGPGFFPPDIARVLKEHQARRDHERGTHTDSRNGTDDSSKGKAMKEHISANPLMQASSLPYELPDFANITAAHVQEAITEGMARQRAAWEEIASSNEPVTPGILEKIETCGELLSRALSVCYTVLAATGDEDYQRIEIENAAALADHTDHFYLDERIYNRLKELREKAEPMRLKSRDLFLLDKYLRDFATSGVALDEADKAKLRELNARISTLTADFSQRAVAGLDEGSFKEVPGMEGPINLVSPTAQPVLAHIDDHDLRAKIQHASTSRGDGHDPASDTRQLVLDLARARAERAQLLGFASHAAVIASTSTAQSTDAIDALLKPMVEPTMDNASLEATDLIADMEKDRNAPEGEHFSASDWLYYADRATSRSGGISDEELSQYLELDNVIERGIFFAANRLYGLTFTERPDLTGYTESCRVWEVFQEPADPQSESGPTPIGLFLGDYYTRPGKHGGAWMNDIIHPSGLFERRPVVCNNLNIDPPAPSEPTLLTTDEARTVFHEFGHALHSLLTEVYYPSVAGTNVPRDFVEYPSQVNEMWLANREVLEHMLIHYQTGEAAPASYIDHMMSSDTEGAGFHMCEMLGAVLLDQAWHRLRPEEVPTAVEDVAVFEENALLKAKIANNLVPPRYRSTYFNHIFGGGYDAGYYSYLWSEAYDADTVEWFKKQENNGLSRAAGDAFVEAVLSRGYSRDPRESFKALTGREVDVEPLLRRHGLL